MKNGKQNENLKNCKKIRSNIEMLLVVIGVLGFILSIVIFINTRLERRKILVLDLECIYNEISQKFKNEIGECEENILLIRVMNTGQQAVAVDKNTFKIIGPKKNVKTYETDWFGLDDIPYPLNPGESFEVGIFEDSFTSFQGYEGYSEDIIPISVEVLDIQGKLYKTKLKYNLLLAVSAIEKSSK